MKKGFLSLAAFVAFSFANAQSKEKGVIELTPKIGSSSFTEFIENNSTEYNSGMEIGATVDYYFNDRWSFHSGLVANKMGGKYKDSNSDPNYAVSTYEDKLHYLSVPLNANWHFGSTRKWNLNFGLSPSFLTTAKIKENKNTITIPKDQIESFQLGFTYGIGYKIQINDKFGILIESQWFNGLTNINKSSEDRIVNGGFSFNIGGVIQL